MELTLILEKVYQKLVKEITEASYENKIDEVLKKYDLQDEIEYSYYDIKNSKILIIGDSLVDKNDLINIARKYGIKENRIEFELDYNKLTNYNFGKLRNSMNYSDVLVGPIPHKVGGIEGYSSFLAMTDDMPEEYPKIIRLESSNELKITRQSFINGLLNSRLYNDLYN